MRLAVKVVPGARRDALVGWLGDELKVAVSAPLERGKANDAVKALLEAALGTSVALLRGHASPRKVFDVPGLDDAEARARLAAATRR